MSCSCYGLLTPIRTTTLRQKEVTTNISFLCWSFVVFSGIPLHKYSIINIYTLKRSAINMNDVSEIYSDMNPKKCTLQSIYRLFVCCCYFFFTPLPLPSPPPPTITILYCYFTLVLISTQFILFDYDHSSQFHSFFYLDRWMMFVFCLAYIASH